MTKAVESFLMFVRRFQCQTQVVNERCYQTIKRGVLITRHLHKRLRCRWCVIVEAAIAQQLISEQRVVGTAANRHKRCTDALIKSVLRTGFDQIHKRHVLRQIVGDDQNTIIIFIRVVLQSLKELIKQVSCCIKRSIKINARFQYRRMFFVAVTVVAAWSSIVICGTDLLQRSHQLLLVHLASARHWLQHIDIVIKRDHTHTIVCLQVTQHMSHARNCFFHFRFLWWFTIWFDAILCRIGRRRQMPMISHRLTLIQQQHQIEFISPSLLYILDV
mmetsp:Transcript_24682/g.39863  ORF Transcript_24682/g.39863 Transcript_24682/m.39863 type:complete len:274 (-) Transcript_24682:2605-3426(-)